MRGVEYRAPPSRRNHRFQRMSPEERVHIALEMSNSIAKITMESIKNQNPHISTTRLLEKTRKRFQAGRRHTADLIMINSPAHRRKGAKGPRGH